MLCELVSYTKVHKSIQNSFRAIVCFCTFYRMSGMLFRAIVRFCTLEIEIIRHRGCYLSYYAFICICNTVNGAPGDAFGDMACLSVIFLDRRTCYSRYFAFLYQFLCTGLYVG